MEQYKKWLEEQIEVTLEDKDLQREHWAYCTAYRKLIDEMPDDKFDKIVKDIEAASASVSEGEQLATEAVDTGVWDGERCPRCKSVNLVDVDDHWTKCRDCKFRFVNVWAWHQQQPVIVAVANCHQRMTAMFSFCDLNEQRYDSKTSKRIRKKLTSKGETICNIHLSPIVES